MSTSTPNPTFNLNTFLRADIAAMETYTPILPFDVLSAKFGLPVEQIIKLDANENPYGPSPKVKQALTKCNHLHIYPDPESRILRQALSDYTGIPDEYLLVGHGADELIDLILRLFITSGDQIINCPPTFGMYTFDADINGAQVISIPRRADFQLDIPAIKNAVQHASHAKLIFITSPNNPDGSPISETDLKKLLNLPIVVILDEAYVEFYTHSYIRDVINHPNLIVLRTFSKWAGLAGLRVGYGAFPLEIGRHLWKIKQPYNVNVAGQLAALASLEDATYLKTNVAKIVATRTQFAEALTKIPWLEPYPSQANFILVKLTQRDASEVKQALAQQGIFVRYYDKPGLQNHLRFSIGTPQQMDALLKGLQTL